MNDDLPDAGKFRFWFPFMPETVIEAAERLNDSDDAYDRYLAYELSQGYEACPSDISDYRGVDL